MREYLCKRLLFLDEEMSQLGTDDTRHNRQPDTVVVTLFYNNFRARNLGRRRGKWFETRSVQSSFELLESLDPILLLLVVHVIKREIKRSIIKKKKN